MNQTVFESFIDRAIRRMQAQVPDHAQSRDGVARISHSGVQILCRAKQIKKVVRLSFFIEDKEISQVAVQAILEDRSRGRIWCEGDNACEDSTFSI